jgi:vacuolar-type H+-ATPase subunit B/Vma2
VGEKGILSPGGTTESAEDEFQIVVDAMSFQESQIFFFKGHFAVTGSPGFGCT